MAIQLVSFKCPECGANLPVEEGRKEMFCSYCGTKIVISNDNEHVYRHIDEARIKKVEADTMVELKRLELVEQQRSAKVKNKKLKIIVSITLAIVIVLSFVLDFVFLDLTGLAFLGIFGLLALLVIWGKELGGEDEDDDILHPELVRVPDGIFANERLDYTVVETLFKEAGFTNIRCVPLYDLWLQKKQNVVESISINGKKLETICINEKNIIVGKRRFQPDASVVITYHCKKAKR